MQTIRPRSLMLWGALALAAATTVAAERVVLEAVLVRVNDRIITISDFRERLRQELSQMPGEPVGDELLAFAEQMLDSVVEEMILLERADEKDLTVDEEMVDSAIDNLRQENKLVDDEAFEEAMSAAGLSVAGLRDRYRQNILLQRALQGEVQPTEITSEEVHRVYEEEKQRFKVPAKVELEQLFFPVAEDRSEREAVMRRVRGLVERVSRGADLRAEATLAGVELQELGAIPVGDLRPDLRDALAGLDDNGLTEPMATSGGFQVIRLLRRIPEGYQPFEDVKELLRRRLSQKSYQDQTRGMVQRLKSEYLVEVHREYLAQMIAGGGDV